jgi:hypothetical protein
MLGLVKLGLGSSQRLLCVANMPIWQSVIILSDVMLSVVAPIFNKHSYCCHLGYNINISVPHTHRTFRALSARTSPASGSRQPLTLSPMLRQG